MNNLKKKHTEIIMALVEQEKKQVASHIESLKRRADWDGIQKVILLKTHGVRYFQTATKIKNAEKELKILNDIIKSF